MSAAILRFLETERAAHPSAAAEYAELADLYHRKLWHQLTVRLERFAAAHGSPLDGDNQALVRLYERFVHDFEAKVNPLSLVKIAAAASRQLLTPADSLAMLVPLADRVRAAPAAHVLALSCIGHAHLAACDMPHAREAIDAAEAELGDVTGLDAVVYAQFFHLSMLYRKAREEAELFYRAALSYLSYVKLSDVPVSEQRDLARDLALAALIGPQLYNIGELLAHAICERLDDSEETKWLHALLIAFNSGDIAKFAAALSSAPAGQSLAALQRHETRLRQKVCILSLMELVFRRGSANRRLPFTEIAAATGLPLDEVERLSMKALSLGLVRGTIDEVEKVFGVSWVQPRVLGKAQILSMVGKIDEWSARISTALASIQQQPDSS